MSETNRRKLINITETTEITDASLFYISKDAKDNSIKWQNIKNSIGLSLYEAAIIKTDTTINASLNNNLIIADPNTTQNGTLSITLDAGVGLAGNRYVIAHGSTPGLVKVKTSGAETFTLFNSALTSINLYSSGQFITVTFDGSSWLVEEHMIYMDVGFVNRSDWTAIRAGNGVTYDTKSAAVDFSGMTFSDGTNTATCVHDSGGVALSGILYFYDASGGSGVFTDGATLTASSGDTALVNELSGSSKNIDYSIYHGMGVDINNLKCDMYLSTDGTYANAQSQPIVESNFGGNTGYKLTQNDVNSIYQETWNGGIYSFTFGGAADIWDGDDRYINLKVRF